MTEDDLARTVRQAGEPGERVTEWQASSKKYPRASIVSR